VGVTGCAPFWVGAAVGAGGIAWVNGSLERDFCFSMDRVSQASRQALKRLKLPVRDDKGDFLTTKIQSQYSDGQKIWIDIKAVTERSCKVIIRVGVFGHRSRSESILAAIIRYLE
ncbi:MAG: DUF3568 family protein, partial [Candidatus Omnitrophota bacterium]